MAPSHELRSNHALNESSFVRIEAWADEAVQAITTLRLRTPPPPPPPPDATPPIRGTTMKLEIPLDGRVGDGQAGDTRRSTYLPQRPLSRRDSMKRRDALLMGKEGSRRRQRWENNRLAGNPYAEPPLPSDWEVHPTHPVHAVPYFLAPLWDAKYAERNAERRKKERIRKSAAASVAGEKGVVPKDLRQKLKRARGAKYLLQDLEQQVRNFVQQWENNQRMLEDEAICDPDSSEDDEVVFVGRNGQMHNMRSPRRFGDGLQPEKLVFDSLENDHSASFGRWLVHSIGAYYGLNTWSVTVGDPARREAYVGIKEIYLKPGRSKVMERTLPRPLWAIV